MLDAAKPQVAPVSQIELLQTKEQLQNKLLLLKSQVERALSERQFSEAAQVNVCHYLAVCCCRCVLVQCHLVGAAATIWLCAAAV